MAAQQTAVMTSSRAKNYHEVQKISLQPSLLMELGRLHFGISTRTVLKRGQRLLHVEIVTSVFSPFRVAHLLMKSHSSNSCKVPLLDLSLTHMLVQNSRNKFFEESGDWLSANPADQYYKARRTMPRHTLATTYFMA